jgi:Leucine-rich repeat (LRR) protein
MLFTTARTVCLLSLACWVGCKPEAPTNTAKNDRAPVVHSQNAEVSFDEQLRLVRSGISTTIRVTTTVSDQQLSQLSNNQLLEELLLDAGEVDDSSVQLLVGLPGLRHLRLRHSALTDQGITKLLPEELPELQILNLPQSQLTAGGLEHLRQFPKLKQLRLGGEMLDDMAAVALAQLPSLESLHLIAPRFTDEALQQLANSPHLASLYIDQCHFSDAAWKKLFQAKPNLHVHIDQHHHDLDPKRDH